MPEPHLPSNYSPSVNISGDISVEQYYFWSALTDVKYFHNNIDKNYGWLIKVTETNLVQLDSKEAVNESRRVVSSQPSSVRLRRT